MIKNPQTSLVVHDITPLPCKQIIYCYSPVLYFANFAIPRPLQCCANVCNIVIACVDVLLVCGTSIQTDDIQV